MSGMASSSASTASREVRRGPPIPATASQKPPGADPELEPTGAHDVERDRRLGQHRRLSEGQVGDIGKDADPGRSRQEVRDQGEGVEEPPLVGMVLDPDDVQPTSLRRQDLLDERRVGVRQRRDRDPEAQWRSRGLARGPDADSAGRGPVVGWFDRSPPGEELVIPGNLSLDELEGRRQFPHVLLDPAAMILEQSESFGRRCIALLYQLGVGVEILDRHARRSQTLNELDPAHVVVAEATVAAL